MHYVTTSHEKNKSDLLLNFNTANQQATNLNSVKLLSWVTTASSHGDLVQKQSGNKTQTTWTCPWKNLVSEKALCLQVQGPAQTWVTYSGAHINRGIYHPCPWKPHTWEGCIAKGTDINRGTNPLSPMSMENIVFEKALLHIIIQIQGPAPDMDDI